MTKLILQNWKGLKIPLLPDQTLLEAIHAQRLDWMHLCGKKGRCVTCRIKIISGGELLNPLTKHELRFQKLNALATDERLSCQAICPSSQEESVIVGYTPKATQLPHLLYEVESLPEE